MSYEVFRNATREFLGRRSHFDDALELAREEAANRGVGGDVVIRDEGNDIVAHVWRDGYEEIERDVPR